MSHVDHIRGAWGACKACPALPALVCCGSILSSLLLSLGCSTVIALCGHLVLHIIKQCPYCRTETCVTLLAGCGRLLWGAAASPHG